MATGHATRAIETEFINVLDIVHAIRIQARQRKAGELTGIGNLAAMDAVRPAAQDAGQRHGDQDPLAGLLI